MDISNIKFQEEVCPKCGGGSKIRPKRHLRQTLPRPCVSCKDGKITIALIPVEVPDGYRPLPFSPNYNFILLIPKDSNSMEVSLKIMSGLKSNAIKIPLPDKIGDTITCDRELPCEGLMDCRSCKIPTRVVKGISVTDKPYNFRLEVE